MFATKVLVPVLALAGYAAAQGGCAQPTITISAQADADALASCPTLSGDVVISTAVSGEIKMNSVQKIGGSLIANGVVGMTALTMNNLSSIGAAFDLEQLTVLSALTFPNLVAVGSIKWITLPALSELGFTQGISKASAVIVQDTFLGALDGIDLMAADTIDIISNFQLTKFETQLASISKSLTIKANGKNLNASFPNLVTAVNMTFSNCTGIKIPSLATVNGTLGFYENYFGELIAPNLTSVGLGITFQDNPSVSNVSFPMLSSLAGGLSINNNPDILVVDGFPKLSKINGNVNCTGAFTNVSLPALSNVRGAFSLVSSADVTNDCNHFNSIHGSVIQGKVTCKGKSTDSTGGSSTSPSGSTATKASSAATIDIKMAALVSFTAVVGAMINMLV